MNDLESVQNDSGLHRVIRQPELVSDMGGAVPQGARLDEEIGRGGVIVRVTAYVRITDPIKLAQYAKRRKIAVVGDPLWRPIDDVDAVATALVTCNENPTPGSYGIDVIAYATGEVIMEPFKG